MRELVPCQSTRRRAYQQASRPADKRVANQPAANNASHRSRRLVETQAVPMPFAGIVMMVVIWVCRRRDGEAQSQQGGSQRCCVKYRQFHRKYLNIIDI